jgi:creatinine amidohydrolase
MRLLHLLAVTVSLTAAAAPSDNVYLEQLTSTEVAARLRAGKVIAIVPLGGTEQSGANIVLGKHNVRAHVIAGDIARALGDAIVAPVIAYVPEGSIDPPSGHMRGAGTISIPVDAFEKTLEASARSLLKHGFTAVVLLGDHGGYQSSLHRVAERTNRSLKRNAILVPREYYRELQHAGTADIELSLAVDPNLVRHPGAARLEPGRAARADIVESTARALRRALGR